jgi:zinc transport system permease protein
MIEMFQYDFIIRAFIAGITIAILAAISGSFIVLKRYSILTETLAHSALVGVALGILLGTAPLLIAVFTALLSAWLIEYLRSFHNLYSDSILAIFLSASLAIAIIIVSLAGEFNSSLFSYLFGSILSVTTEDLIMLALFGIISLSVLLGFFKEFYFIAFDEEVAQTSGIKVKLLNFLFITIVAIIIALSIRIVGTLLIGALMVIPTISALQFKRGFLETMIIALIISVISVIIGITLSYHFSLPSGATIVLTILLFFITSLVTNRKLR